MSFNPSAVRILNNLVTRLNQRQNESGAFDGGDVTKDINLKNQSALVLFDTEDDTITLRAPADCSNYVLRLPDAPGSAGNPLVIDTVISDEITEVNTKFAADMKLSSLETQALVATEEQVLSIVPSTDLRVFNNGNETRILTLIDFGDPNNDYRFSMFEHSAQVRESLGASTTFNVGGFDFATNTHFFIKHASCALNLPTNATTFDNDYNSNVSSSNGPPAINNRYSIKIVTDGANSCQLNMNAPTGFTPFNLTFPYTVPAASIATLTFIKRTAAPTYLVFVELTTLIT